jgi:putative membrane protein
MHWGGDFGMGFGGSWILMIIFWGFIILGVVYLIKMLRSDGSIEERKSETAQEVLEIRFARGELKKKEFEDAQEVLKKHRQ